MECHENDINDCVGPRVTVVAWGVQWADLDTGQLCDVVALDAYDIETAIEQSRRSLPPTLTWMPRTVYIERRDGHRETVLDQAPSVDPVLRRVRRERAERARESEAAKPARPSDRKAFDSEYADLLEQCREHLPPHHLALMVELLVAQQRSDDRRAKREYATVAETGNAGDQLDRLVARWVQLGGGRIRAAGHPNGKDRDVADPDRGTYAPHGREAALLREMGLLR